MAQRCIVLDITHVMVQDAAKTVIKDCGLAVQCRFLCADEVRSYAKDESNDIEDGLAERLEHGYDFCFAALHEDRLVSYCWLAKHSIEAEYNRANGSATAGIGFSFPADHAFRYKGFTHPNYRGLRLYRRVGAEACLAMQTKGVQYLLSTTEFVNYGAIRSARRSGYEILGHACLIGVGPWQLVFGPDLSSRGILMGKQANVLERNAHFRHQEADGGLPMTTVPAQHVSS